MTTFLDHLQRGTNLTTTENGAVTNKSSLDPIVDFFGLAGAMRNTPEKAAELFEAAFHAEPQTALRTLFYLRDVRGGQGERDVFRHSLHRLRNTISPTAFDRIIEHVPFYGRWDDLMDRAVLTPSVMAMIRSQLMEDQRLQVFGEPISLLAKWLPSENASSSETKSKARFFAEQLGFSARSYRLMLSKLRNHIRLLEQDMSRNNWDEIDYSKIPSQAHRRHVKAFKRQTPERYQAYLDSVQKGEAKINVSNVYPYEIYDMVQKGEKDYANVAWENLPDYTQGKNALVMADVSGSMYGQPMAVSVSLALYFAERNTGAFHDYFMTFSSEPQLVKVQGANLAQRMANISQAQWSQNTDLSKAFRAIKQAAVLSKEDAPKVLYIISDMEFDQASPRNSGHYETRVVTSRDMWSGQPVRRVQNVWVQDPLQSTDTIFETAKREYAEVGLELPHVVFWNVNARQAQAPALANDGNVSLVSGCSPVIFAQAVEGKTPRELVDQVVNAERYQRIVI